LEELSGIAGLSTFYLSRTFKDAKHYKELDVNLSNIKDLPGIAVVEKT
jgi:hypothetical protein